MTPLYHLSLPHLLLRIPHMYKLPIVGGVVGGLVALVVVIILVILRFRRRGHGNRATIDPDAEPKVEPFIQTDSQQRDAGPPSGSKRPALQVTGSSVRSALPAHQLGIGPFERSLRVQQTQPILTDDQADFVNSLHANNVLAAAIARVMQSMMAAERRPAIEGRLEIEALGAKVASPVHSLDARCKHPGGRQMKESPLFQAPIMGPYSSEIGNVISRHVPQIIINNHGSYGRIAMPVVIKSGDHRAEG
ncbi:hypothetical protein BU15DRAFT_67037 [Melanogaster broomeanus]|nr:hypothetical protein BU15DRAFT_67037 [Melanogaster broomeanus]